MSNLDFILVTGSLIVSAGVGLGAAKLYMDWFGSRSWQYDLWRNHFGWWLLGALGGGVVICYIVWMALFFAILEVL